MCCPPMTSGINLHERVAFIGVGGTQTVPNRITFYKHAFPFSCQDLGEIINTAVMSMKQLKNWEPMKPKQ